MAISICGSRYLFHPICSPPRAVYAWSYADQHQSFMQFHTGRFKADIRTLNLFSDLTYLLYDDQSIRCFSIVPVFSITTTTTTNNLETKKERIEK